jgi:hypothetical protein
MRQDHKGGEKLFVDYGEGLSLVDPQTSVSSFFQMRQNREI